MDNGGQISGILVHDSRDASTAHHLYRRKAACWRRPRRGARLIMIDGTIEQSAAGGAQLSVLTFQSYTFNLDQFAGADPRRRCARPANGIWASCSIPPKQGVTPQIRAAYLAEAHNRLSQPLYCLAFAMIALARSCAGGAQRGALAMRLTMARRWRRRPCASPAMAWPARPPASRRWMCFFYLIPLLGAGFALAGR